MLPNPCTICVTICYLTPPTPVMGWAASSGLTEDACCSSNEHDPEMTLVSIAHTTKGACEEKKRNDTVDLAFLFFLFLLFPFSLPLACCLPSPSTIKGEAGRPMRGIKKQAAEAYTHATHRDLGALPSLAYLYTPTTNSVQVT
jgi:hypothetical protein